MGGKNDKPYTGQIAPPEMPEQDIGALMQAMLMMTSMAAPPPTPELPPTPQVYKAPEIDWTEKNKQLAAKAKAEFGVDKARRKGRSDTILTSPLLDDEETTTTSSLLTAS